MKKPLSHRLLLWLTINNDRTIFANLKNSTIASVMKQLYILLLLLCHSFSVYPIYFKQLSMQDGLSQLSVVSIYQDKLGRMWFGTLEGLNRYDGETLVSYKPGKKSERNRQQLLSGNEIYSIVGDKEGNVFFKADQTFMMYDIAKEYFHLIAGKGVVAVTSRQGEIWIARYDSILKWDAGTRSLVFQKKTNLSSEITRLEWDQKNRLWIGTKSGLYGWEEGGEVVCRIPDKDIYSIYESSQAELWVSTRMEGLYKIDRQGSIIKYLHNPADPASISSNQTREFTEDNQGNLWIGTYKGLCKYVAETNRFSTYTTDNLPGSLSHSSVFSLCKDAQGTIWAGTYYGGINYFNPESDIYTYYAQAPSRNDCLDFPFVGNMAEDNTGNIWICTEGGGLNRLDRKTDTFTHFTAHETGNTLRENNLKSIYYDSKRDKVYIGTHTGGLSVYNINNKTFKNFLEEKNPIAPHSIIHDMKPYQDKLIFLDREGLFLLDMDTEQISPLFPGVSYKDRPFAGLGFTIDSKGYLWLIKTDRILRISIQNSADKEIFINEENGLGAFSALKIIETKAGQLYIGTRGSGLFLFNERDRTFSRYTAADNFLLSNYCYNMSESESGHLLITGDKGISFFDPEKGMVKQIRLDAGLPISSINLDCGLLVCRDGEVFVGSADGLLSFSEKELYRRDKDYSFYFSDLYIHNKRVYPEDGQAVLASALPFTTDVYLTYKQNNLIVHFASSNYISNQKNVSYEYMLDGFDTNWIPTTKTSLHYTNLNPGKYTLHVREKELYSEKPLRQAALKLTIHSPYYATVWAFFVYLSILSAILYTILYFRKSKARLAASLETEKREKERIEEINQAKLLFFTNISHEFKTPLTLIISHVDALLQNRSLAPPVYNKILKTYKQAQQMRQLINELLDFRKLEQKHVRLKVCEKDLVSFLKEIYLTFYEYAAPHAISYRFVSDEETLHGWFDAGQLQKVFNNLLSNAFKVTKAGDFIEVVLTHSDTDFVLKVIDSGMGIEQKDLDKVFDRFFQPQRTDEVMHGNTGTGIGLSLSKNIVELHHGTISVESSPGYGSIFTVTLPKGRAHFVNDKTVTFISEAESDFMETDTLTEVEYTEQPVEVYPDCAEKEELYTILIVEDKEELLQVLSSLFSPLYHVRTACNGAEGLRMVQEERPDLVLSDVMMPVMSGIEMCFQIKSNRELSHIPVVLLTALTSPEKHIEGFQRGADDYIAKPFHAKVLLARCNNLIRSRKLVRKEEEVQQRSDIALLAGNTLDKKFLEHAALIIEEHFADPDFNINILARELTLSRSSLFARFKALTGETPNDYILNVKLKHAATLLKERPELQIVEISEQVGFSSQQYFSRCFKARYNLSPLDYRKS